jgi:RNA polymerase sigma factor (sigma-70 family)
MAGEDHALIRRAIAGEDQAVDLLILRLMPVIRARVRRALAKSGMRLGPSDGDDLVQEMWLRLIDDGGRRLLEYDAERGASLEGYVGMISERELGNLSRAVATKKRGGHLVAVEAQEDLVADVPNPAETAEAENLAARLGEHLDRALPPRGRLVFRYAFTDDLPPNEVAKILGVTVQVVYNWQHKIRAAARDFLGST